MWLWYGALQLVIETAEFYSAAIIILLGLTMYINIRILDNSESLLDTWIHLYKEAHIG